MSCVRSSSGMVAAGDPFVFDAKSKAQSAGALVRVFVTAWISRSAVSHRKTA